MAKKKRSALNIALLITSVVSLFTRLFSLVKTESHIARKNIGIIIMMTILISGLFLSTWLCALYLFFLFLTSLPLSAPLALGVMILANIILILICLLIISHARKQLTFSVLRKHFRTAGVKSIVTG